MSVAARTTRWLLIVISIWAMIFALHFSSIGGQWWPLETATWALMVVWVWIYALSYLLAARWRERVPSVAIQPTAWWNGWVAATSVAASAGALLIIYEFAILRGYGFATPVSLVRIAEVESGGGGSWVSGIGRMLSPALLVGWIMAVLGWSAVRPPVRLLLVGATGLVFYQQAMFEGGRFFFASLLSASVVARLFAPVASARPRRLNITGKLALAVLFVLAVVVFGYVFVDRAAASEIAFGDAYALFVSDLRLELGHDLLAKLDGPAGAVWFASSMLWTYVTHAMSELDVLLREPNLVHAYGLYQFPQLGQLLTKMTGASYGYDVFSQLPSPGMYVTLYGASYIDFGHAGAMVTAVTLGAVTGKAMRHLASGRFAAFGLAAPLLWTVGLFAPITSVVTNLWPAMIWCVFIGLTAATRTVSAKAASVPAV